MGLAEPANGNFYCFDDVVVDGENFRVKKGGRDVTLTPRAFDVLVFLIKNGGRVAEKQEIFESVWKDTFVTDNALAKIIKEIRHALADRADSPHYIETIPRRGYRFIGEVKVGHARPNSLVEKTGDDDDAPNTAVKEIPPGEKTAFPARRESRQQQQQQSAFPKTVLILPLAVLIVISGVVFWLTARQNSAETRPAPIRSIAVLPFKPLDADSRDASLEMGMAETLITRLSNLKQITVRPMSAVRPYTDPHQDSVKAGQNLQVEAVLDGSIQKAGERVRVTVRLTDTRDGSPLWSAHFDENFTDIFKVQDSIAERVTGALTLELSRQERERLGRHHTENAEAYQLYLRGQLHWHRRQPEWTEQSLAYYRQALEKDPNFALAHIGVADAHITLSGQRKIGMREAETEARRHIMKALEIDDSLALAHNALAELKYQFEYDWAGAEREFQTALELNPNVAWIHQAYGWFLMSQGRFDEAAARMERAGELDPSSLTVNTGRGRLFYYSRQYDLAAQQFQNIIAVEPNEGGTQFALFTVYEQSGRYEEALETQIQMMSRNGAPPGVVEDLRETFRASGWHGCLRKRLEFLERLAKDGKQVNPHGLAQLYVRLGEKDKAFEQLRKVFEMRDPTIIQFKVEPVYDSLRGDPRYDELVRQIGLQP